MKKNRALAIAAALAVGGFLILRAKMQRSGSNYSAGVRLTSVDVPAQNLFIGTPTVWPGTPTMYAPRTTGVASAMAYGFNNATPTGEAINGFV